MWYLLAYAYCLLIYAAASHFKMGYQLLALVSPLLLLLYYILGRYSVLFFGESLPYYWSRNFLITAIPMFTLGFVMPELNIKWLTNQNILILSIISVLLLFAECMAFYTSLPIGRNNFIFNMPLSFLIVYYATHQLKLRFRKTIFSLSSERNILCIFMASRDLQSPSAPGWSCPSCISIRKPELL